MTYLDTKSKIVSANVLKAQSNAVIFGGWFDPVTPDVARMMERFAREHEGSKLLTVVFDGPDTLLPADSRAILMAALRSIDLVAVLPYGKWAGFMYGQRKQLVPHSRDFINLVFRRNAAVPASYP